MTLRRSRWLVAVVALIMLVAACTSDSGDTASTTAAPGTDAPATTTGPTDAAPDSTAAPDTTAAPSGEAVVYDRAETIITGGKQWGPPSNFNPVQGDYATGALGLLYETLFLFDELNGEYIPWLAESEEWVDDTTYQVTLRQGVQWHDGEAFDSEDVVTTFNLLAFPSARFSGMWVQNGGSLSAVEAIDDYTVQFTFDQPLYQQWGERIYDVPILPAHLWADRSEEEVATGVNENPVGTGAFMYETHDQTRVVYERNDNWWATAALGLDMAPRWMIDLVNSSNNVALGQVLAGEVDLNNNFLPGIATLVQGGYGLHTFYPEAPYMMPANTAWLVLNTTKPPMDDPAFRKAMAHAIDTQQIVEVVYGNLVEAANPTGLLPTWEEFVDQAAVDELGFSYDPDEARQILADAGYADSDGDGFVETPGGDPISLTLIVPSGWSDWMESIRVISEGAQAVGINVTTDFPDFAALLEARNSGNFDMVINNDRQGGSTPWLYYDYVFSLPIQETQVSANFGRYENQEAADLVDAFDHTPRDDTAELTRLSSEIQSIFLEELPVIPLWYNGLWAQMNTQYWTNWPTAGSENQNMPSTWGGYWNKTGVLTLANVEPVTPE